MTKSKRHETTIRGRKTRVTVPENPKPEDVLADAIRENLSPEAVATIVGYLQPVRTLDPKVYREVRWFSDLLTTVVGGVDQLNRLFEEVGL